MATGLRCAAYKSFTTLINTSYSMNGNEDSGVLSNPLSFLHSGDFVWYSAGLNHSDYGRYWSLCSYSTVYSFGLRFYNTNLNPQLTNERGDGFAVRCTSTRLQILHHSH